MVNDLYYFKTALSPQGAILIPNTDIKKVYESQDTENETKTVFEWLIQQAKGFRLYDINAYFVLAMKEECKMVVTPTWDVLGPYSIADRSVRVSIDEIPEDSTYSELLELARKLTPDDKKLAFPPGQYHFVTGNEYRLGVKEILSKDSADSEEGCSPATEDASSLVPTNFKLVVGKDGEQETFKLNKAVISCFLPGLESLIGDMSV